MYNNINNFFLPSLTILFYLLIPLLFLTLHACSCPCLSSFRPSFHFTLLILPLIELSSSFSSIIFFLPSIFLYRIHSHPITPFFHLLSSQSYHYFSHFFFFHFLMSTSLRELILERTISGDFGEYQNSSK